MDSSDDIRFDHLSDRELLILVCHDLRSIRSSIIGHGQRIRSLENWQTRLVAGWGALAAAGGTYIAYLRASHPAN